MSDLVNRQDVIDALVQLCENYTPTKMTHHPHIDMVIYEIARVPSVELERKKGKWEEKHHTFSGECPIDQWQSCKCSECGRYDTRPYLYYFVEPKFCSWCGAEMSEEKEAEE